MTALRAGRSNGRGRSFALLLGAALCAIAGAAEPASAVRDWAAPVAVEGPSQRARGDVVFTAGGGMLAAWSRLPTGASVPMVRFAVAPADGAFGPPTELSTDGGDPALAVDGDGAALIAWPGVTGSVYATERSPAGDLGPPRPIATGAGLTQVALNARGDAIVTYLRTSPDGSSAIWASRRASGAEFGPPEQVSPRLAPGTRLDRRDIAMTPQGDALVTWEEPTAMGLTRIQVSVAPSADAFSAPFTLSDEQRNGLDPAIATDATQHTVVAWTDAQPGAEVGVIRWALRVPGRSQSTGEPLEPHNSFGSWIAWPRAGTSSRIHPVSVSPEMGS